MATFLDFEKPIAELEARIAELRETASAGEAEHRGRDRPARGALGAAAARHLCQADAVAEDPGRPPPRAAPFRRLCRGAGRGFRAARRRPQFRRRQRRGRRPRPAGRPQDRRHRPGEGRRHRQPPRAQFRHGPAGRLSQGDPADGPGRPVRPAGGHPGRHARRLSRRPGRGARPGRGDRPRDREVPRDRRAAGHRDHRRGHVGRRDRHRRRQPRADARTFDLLGDLARRLRLDPVAHRRQGAPRPPRRCGSPPRT